MAKNVPFHIKSPVKNFHGWAKGGHRTVALTLNTPLCTVQYTDFPDGGTDAVTRHVSFAKNLKLLLSKRVIRA